MFGTTSLAEVRRYLAEHCNCTEAELVAPMQVMVAKRKPRKHPENELRRLLKALNDSVSKVASKK